MAGSLGQDIEEALSLGILIFSLILDYSINGILVGIAYYSLKAHFQWKFSGQKNFLILLLIFAFLDNFLVPMFSVLDATITIRNPEILQWIDLKPDEPLIGLLGFGWFEFIIYCIQTLLATYVGDKIFIKKLKLYHNSNETDAKKPGGLP